MAHETIDDVAGAVVTGTALRYDHCGKDASPALAGGIVSVCCQLW